MGKVNHLLGLINLLGLNPEDPGDLREMRTMRDAGLVSSLEYDAWYGSLRMAEPPIVQMPENCSECNHHNPYVGKEHITDTGQYVCRQCRPRWDRKRSLVALKVEADAREARKTDYSR